MQKISITPTSFVKQLYRFVNHFVHAQTLVQNQILTQIAILLML